MNCSIRRLGNLGTLGSNESPVLLVFRAFYDPLVNELLLLVVEFEMGVGRRHHFIRIRTDDSLPDEGFLWVSRDNGLSRFSLSNGAFGIIETQASLPRIFVETVAFETAVRQERPHIQIEVKGFRLCRH